MPDEDIGNNGLGAETGGREHLRWARITEYVSDNDRIFSSQEVEATAKAYNAKSHIFPNMAHDMMLEPGWKQVADEIIAWFDQLGL